MAAVHPPKVQAAVQDDPGTNYRLLADTIPLMVWTARADGRVDFVNRRVVEYTGRDAAELQGEGWGEVVHPADRQRVGEAWQRALESGKRSENDMRLRRADGEYRWHHGTGVPLHDAAGRVTRWFGICTDIEELRAAEQRLRALIENEPECVKLIDAQGRLLEMNAAGLRMIEAGDIEEVRGRSVYPLVVPEHREAFRSLTERVCRGERGGLEFEIVGLKGTRRLLETRAAPFPDERGGTLLLSITRDITDRHRAERALRESEQRFLTFLENLPANAWIRDANFRYTYANRRYAEAWHQPSEVLIGRDAAELFPPDVAEYFRENDAAVLRRNEPVHFVDTKPSGKWLKVKFPVPDGKGGIGVAGIALDIAERSRLEEALVESEARFRSFMHNAPAVAWIKDSKFRYTYVNPCYERLYGRAEREVLGRDDFELHDAALAQFFRADDERILALREAAQKVHELPYRDGRAGHWLVVKFPLSDASGAMGVGGIAVDITPRLEAEDKVRRYAADVRQLMDRLVGAQEAERRRVADDLHDLIGQNLTALGIGLQTLKQQLEGGSAGAARIDAMAALVETTIDAIRGVMTDLRPAALEEFGLVPALRWYAALFAKRTGMKVSVQAAGPEARLAPEAELAVFRVVQEALTNAAKHSGGGAVELRLARQGDCLRVVVQDDGRGFSDPVGARARRGGFGLPTMRERIEARGGSFSVEQPGRGTRLVIEMPAGGDAD